MYVPFEGKLGAILGTYTFLYLQGSFCTGGHCDDDDPDESKDNGIRVTFAVCGMLAVFGLFVSLVVVPDPAQILSSI